MSGHHNAPLTGTTMHTMQSALPYSTLTDPLFRAQSLRSALVHLSRNAAGMFVVSGLHMPDLLVDLKAGLCLFKTVVHKIGHFLDDVVTVRSITRRPAWVSAGEQMPVDELLSRIGLQALPHRTCPGVEFQLAPSSREQVQNESDVTSAALMRLCISKPVSFMELENATGASPQQVGNFLGRHHALGQLRVLQISTSEAGRVTWLSRVRKCLGL
jgi:hypothetical protein